MFIKIGMVDLSDGDKWFELGQSRAWSWQQGCMLQWRPGSDREIVFNDRDGDRFVCRILDVKTRKLRTLPMAIEHISTDGKQAVCADFRRIQYIRAGYGYAGLPDPNREVLATGRHGRLVDGSGQRQDEIPHLRCPTCENPLSKRPTLRQTL